MAKTIDAVYNGDPTGADDQSLSARFPASDGVGNPLVFDEDQIANLVQYNTGTSVIISLSDEFSDLVAGPGAYTFIWPYDSELYTIPVAYATIAPTGATGIQVDINVNSVSIFSTPLTIDPTYNSSGDAQVPAVLSTTAISAGDVVTFDIDSVGESYEGAGLKVFMYLYRTSVR